MAPRTTFGLKGSTVPGLRNTASTPTACAVRKIVPRLPGSEIRSATSAKLRLAGGVEDGRGRTARSPCGDSVSEQAFITRSETSSASAPRLTNSSIRRGSLCMTASVYKTSLAGEREETTSFASRLPSMIKRPSCMRARRLLCSIRTHCTRWLVVDVIIQRRRGLRGVFALGVTSTARPVLPYNTPGSSLLFPCV